MKNRRIIIFLFMCITLLLFGCDNQSDVSRNANSYGSHNGVKGENMTSREKQNLDSNFIIVYKMERDVYQEFLRNPSYNALQNNSSLGLSHIHEGEWYITCNNIRFQIQRQLFEFLNDNGEIEEFLKQNNVKSDIEHAVVIDSPNMPLTIWVKTTQENSYITINENPEDKLYAYRFYTQSDFDNKYQCKEGKLIVNGNEVQTQNPPKIFNNYADLPFVGVLKALGAQIEQLSESCIIITFEDKDYQLDLENRKFCNVKNKSENLFYKLDGGVYYVYAVNNELMVDSATLHSVLMSMDKKMFISIDLSNKIVRIEV